nr:MAG TPA: hypothetical protein [Bacteriophage sp.]
MEAQILPLSLALTVFHILPTLSGSCMVVFFIFVC